MAWSNQGITVYHGTDDDSARTIVQASARFPAHSIDLSLCTRYTDFGPGFYTTTNEHQARNWANVRAKVARAADPGRVAALVELKVGRERLAEGQVAMLAFVTEGPSTSSDYWAFIRHCRGGAPDHALKYNKIDGRYDVVIGPVSLWTQTLVIKDCDQLSFHTGKALDSIVQSSVIDSGTLSDPYFTI